mmetsp:Transcript_33363/g.50460  ORF Transcript_33363/g.50460 Transcript_33363/m.50460 type:complete len:137 (+) Transcript_33363:92-502(+)
MSMWSAFFLFHTLYELFAGYTNITNPKAFGGAETSIRWQAALGFAQLALATMTLLFSTDTATTAGGKVSFVALVFHGAVTARMFWVFYLSGEELKKVQFGSHLVIAVLFALHVALTLLRKPATAPQPQGDDKKKGK